MANEFKVKNGIIVSGSADIQNDLIVRGILTAKQIDLTVVSSSVLYQSGSTKFGDSQDDTHQITGSVNITGSISLNGSPVGTGKLDETVFNTFSASVNSTTSSQNGRLTSIETATSSLNSFTSSISTTIKSKLNSESVISGSSQLTGTFDGRYILSGSITQTTWDNIANKPSGIVSGSAQVDITSTTGYSAFSSSISSSINNVYDYVTNYDSGQNSRITSLESASSSLNSFTSSASGRLTSLESASSSIRSNFNSYTSSNNGRVSALETASSSLNSFTSSATNRLDAIETSTGSLNGFTSSIATTIKSKLNTENVISGSVQVEITGTTGYSDFSSSISSSIGVLSSSVATTTNSTSSSLGSLSSSLNTRINNVSSSLGTVSSSLVTINNDISSSIGSLSSSVATTTSGLSSSIGSLSSSVATTDSTQNGRLDALETSTSSLNSFSSSSSDKFGFIESTTSSLNTYTSSNNVRVNELETSTGSLNTFTSSIATTIKNKLNTEGVISSSIQVALTGTTGYSTFSSSIATTDGNQNTRLTSIESKTSSYATTGSNSFTGSQYITGAISLYPTVDPDPTGVTTIVTHMFVSASNNQTGEDLYIRQQDNLVKWKWIEGKLNTGILEGGALSYSGSNMYIAKGTGIIVDQRASATSEISPITHYVSWNDTTASCTHLTSSLATYVGMDISGSLYQQDTFFTPAQYRTTIPIGMFNHTNRTSITSVGNNVYTSYDNVNQTNDFIQAFGPLKIEGLSISNQTNSLRLTIESGTSYIMGGFYQQDPNAASHHITNQVVTPQIARVRRNGVNDFTVDNNSGSFYTTIDTAHYDDGSGTLASMGNSDWQIQRAFFNPFTNRVHVYYGQNKYGSLALAKAGLATDSFVEASYSTHQYVFVGYLIVKGNTTNLADTVNNSIVESGLFRNTVGSTGGTQAALNLHDLGDTSVASAVTGDLLSFDGATWTSTKSLTGNYAVTGALVVTGDITARNIIVSSSVMHVTESFASGSHIFGNSLDDVHQFTGSVNITGSMYLNGSLVGTGKLNDTEFYTYTASIDPRISSLEAASASIRNNFNGYTSSINTIIGTLQTSTGSINSFTSSALDRLNAIETSTSSLNTTTSSLNTFTSSASGRLNAIETSTGSLNTFTSSATTRLNALETSSGSLNTFTSSTSNRLTSIETSTSSLNTFTSSASDRLGSLETASGSIRSDFNSYTSSNNNRVGSLESTSGSLNTFTSSASSRLNSIETSTGSLNTFSSSADGRLNSIETSTSSLNTFTSSTATRLTSLESASGSIRSNFNTFTSSVNGKLSSLETSTSSLNTFTSSASGRLNSLENITGSYATTGSNDFKGNQTISGSLIVGTGSLDLIAPEILHVENSGSYNIAHFDGNQDNYVQINLKNHSSHSAASADLVVTADNGTENVHYVDMGINSSNYTAGFVGYANDAYLINAGKDLYVGTVGGLSHPSNLNLFSHNNWETPQIQISGSKQIGFNTTLVSSGYQYEFSGSIKGNNDLKIVGAISSSYFTGSFVGDGANLYNIPASGVTGLQLFKIVSGSVSASISPNNGLEVNTKANFSGSITSSFGIDTPIISNNGHNWEFLAAGQMRPAGTIMGSSYDSNQVDVQNLGPLLLKGVLYGAQVITSPDNGLTSHTWEFGTDGTLTAPGDVNVTGILTAKEIHTTYVTSSVLYDSGSTKFGDTLDDNHQFTGSVNITGSLYLNGTVVGTGKLNQIVFESYTSSINPRINTLETSSINTNNRLFSIESLTGSLLLTSSFLTFSGSVDSRVGYVENNISTQGSRISKLEDVSGSLLTFTSSANTRLTSLESKSSSFATTGSNIFRGNEVISGSLSISGSLDLTNAQIASIKYLHTQGTLSPTWSINHGLGYDYPSVIVYDNNNRVMIPDEIVSIDSNHIDLYFSISEYGHAFISTGGLSTATADKLIFTQTGSFYNTQYNIGITGSLVVNGDIDAHNFNTTSDRKLKTNLIKIDGALDKIEKLNGYTFDWLEEYSEDRTRQIGLIADEVYEVQPELISKRTVLIGGVEEEIKLLDYSKLTALLLVGIKELNDRVTKLEKKNKKSK